MYKLLHSAIATATLCSISCPGFESDGPIFPTCEVMYEDFGGEYGRDGAEVAVLNSVMSENQNARSEDFDVQADETFHSEFVVTWFDVAQGFNGELDVGDGLHTEGEVDMNYDEHLVAFARAADAIVTEEGLTVQRRILFSVPLGTKQNEDCEEELLGKLAEFDEYNEVPREDLVEFYLGTWRRRFVK